MFSIRDYSLVSEQIEYPELQVILRELENAIDSNVEGDVVELGCYIGTTSLFIQRLLLESSGQKVFHVYDSFEGLPKKSKQDRSPAGEQYIAGELHASKKTFIKHFKQAGLPLPIIHRGWFEDLTPADMPGKIAFAFLDGDFYSSIKTSLEVITSLLQPGSTIVIDDYQSESLPGARKAVDEWAKKHSLTLRTEKSLAILKWRRKS